MSLIQDWLTRNCKSVRSIYKLLNYSLKFKIILKLSLIERIIKNNNLLLKSNI